MPKYFWSPVPVIMSLKVTKVQNATQNVNRDVKKLPRVTLIPKLRHHEFDILIKSEVDGRIFTVGNRRLRSHTSSHLRSRVGLFDGDCSRTILCLGNDRLVVVEDISDIAKIIDMRTKKVLLKPQLNQRSLFMNDFFGTKMKQIKFKGDVVLADKNIGIGQLQFEYLYSRERYRIELKAYEHCICKSLIRKLIFTQQGANVNIYALKQSNACLIDSMPLPLDHRIEYMKHVGDDYLCGFVTACVPILLVIQISIRKVMIVNLDIMGNCEKPKEQENNEKAKIMKGDMDLENTAKENEPIIILVTPDTILNASEDIKKVFYSLLTKDPYLDNDKLIRFRVDDTLCPTVMTFTAYRTQNNREFNHKQYKIDLSEISNMTTSNC